MKNIGLITAFPVYLATYFLGFTGAQIIFYNSLSFELNIVMLVIAVSLLLLSANNKIGNWNIPLVLFFYVLISNFFNSMLISYIQRKVSNGEMTRDAEGLSWIIILPSGMILLLICGILFDKIRAKNSVQNNNKWMEGV